MSKLIDLVDEGVLSVQQRSDIFELLEGHHESIADYNEYLSGKSDLLQHSGDKFQRLAQVFETEAKAFEQVLSEAIDIRKGKYFTALPIKKRKQNPPAVAARSPLQALVSLFGSKMTLNEALHLLDQHPRVPSMSRISGLQSEPSPDPWFTMLRKFFTSPDIFPLLDVFHPKNCIGWTRAELLKLVNDRFMYNRGAQVPDEVLEAFVLYSHNAGQLFRIGLTTRKIFVAVYGWETCTEQDVDELSRKTPLSLSKPPPRTDEAEAALRRHMYQFCVGRGSRLTAEMLRQQLNMHVFGPLDEKCFRDVLGHWFLYGRFFVYSGPSRCVQGRHSS